MKECLPARRRNAGIRRLCCLEGVEDRCRESRIGVLGGLGEHLLHAGLEVLVGGLLGARSVLVGNEFISLWREERCTLVRPDAPEVPTKPDIEEVRQVGVGDVVVVGRVRRDYALANLGDSSPSISLGGLRLSHFRKILNHFCYPLDRG